MINWKAFLDGETQLECEHMVDAVLLLCVCKENGIICGDIIPEHYRDKPYWYVKNRTLEITKYYLEEDAICSAWTVGEFLEEHVMV